MLFRFPVPALLLAAATVLPAAPRVDNVLVRMVPPGVTSLVGARMDLLQASDLYRQLMAQQKLPQLDQFAKETGFDPRRDVREMLLFTTPAGTALLARGKFNLKQDPIAGAKLVRHGEYNIRTLDTSGFCILDSTLAVAGEIPAIEAALDEWKQGAHNNAQTLLAKVAGMNAQTQMWGVSTGFASFLARNLPRAGNGIDFSVIFNGMESTWFSATAANGFQAAIHCTAATEKDAMTLRDTAKGLIGLGRLSVPVDQPDLLKFWDGMTVDQSGNAFMLNADIAGNLIDQMVRMFSAPGGRGGSGRGGRGGRGRSGGIASRGRGPGVL